MPRVPRRSVAAQKLLTRAHCEFLNLRIAAGRLALLVGNAEAALIVGVKKWVAKYWKNKLLNGENVTWRWGGSR